MATWNMDIAHSEVEFKAKHMMISTVTGRFEELKGSLTSEKGSLEDANIQINIAVDSINTKQEYRDNHLKSDDFFSAANHPEITIKVNNATKKSDDEYVLHSLIGIKGVEKNVDFTAEYGGIIKDMEGKERMGFEVKGEINRQDFGLTWSALTEAGGAVVSDKIRLQGNLEFVKAD